MAFVVKCTCTSARTVLQGLGREIGVRSTPQELQHQLCSRPHERRPCAQETTMAAGTPADGRRLLARGASGTWAGRVTCHCRHALAIRRSRYEPAAGDDGAKHRNRKLSLLAMPESALVGPFWPDVIVYCPDAYFGGGQLRSTIRLDQSQIRASTTHPYIGAAICRALTARRRLSPSFGA